MIPDFLLNRLDEGSTWRGIVGLALSLIGGAAAALEPEQVELIAAICFGLYTLFKTFFPDKVHVKDRVTSRRHARLDTSPRDAPARSYERTHDARGAFGDDL